MSELCLDPEGAPESLTKLGYLFYGAKIFTRSRAKTSG